MLKRMVFAAGAALLIQATAQAAAPAARYEVVMEVAPGLPTHVVYRPANLSAAPGKLPFIAFGNGGCANVGDSFAILLKEVASRGYVVTAPGPILGGQRPPPGGAPAQSEPGQMTKALDWAVREAGRGGGAYAGRLDVDRMAVMGQSCGGLEAIAAGADPRVKTVVVLNSGIIRGGIPNPDGTVRQARGYLPAGEADLPKLHTPIVYLVGGPTDQAYRGAEADFAAIDRVPIFNANMAVGHGGTWRQPAGGDMAVAAIGWLDWRLKDDRQAASLFTGAGCGLCVDPRWTVKKKLIP